MVGVDEFHFLLQTFVSFREGYVNLILFHQSWTRWFQIFVISNPNPWGNDPIWLYKYVSNGLVQPPTSENLKPWTSRQSCALTPWNHQNQIQLACPKLRSRRLRPNLLGAPLREGGGQEIEVGRWDEDCSMECLVPLIGGRLVLYNHYIITQLAVYIYITYHLLREPETTIELLMICDKLFDWYFSFWGGILQKCLLKGMISDLHKFHVRLIPLICRDVLVEDPWSQEESLLASIKVPVSTEHA